MERTMMVQMHAADLCNLEKAANALGYSHDQFLKLSAHLIANAVLRGVDVIQTPAPSDR